ncbi:ATPase, T2SS/T4P/T4SS family [Streptomyces sp. DW26H14]|uniref:ATPase, T2SS/T4P/T4SS family n=1 Tax=Streptomyces sp. DW26H14 TaxID=3435395 RepID=UPI00403D5FFF
MSLRSRITPHEPDDGQGQESLLVGAYRAKLLQEIDLAEMSALAATERRARLERVLGHIISREGPVLSSAERSQLIRRVVDEALGLGILEPLLEDASISEIMVNGADQVFVERGGRIERLPIRFSSDEQLMQTIERIVSTVNRRVDEANPMVDARLPSGERVNVIIPPLSLTGPILTIRRFPRSFTLAELIELGSLDEQMMLLIAGLVRAKFNVIVSGATGTGKTTLLNALSAMIPDGERIVTIEDSAELQLQQHHVITLESRPANVEGKGQITIRDLVRNSLRMRPDRIIVGEVRGGETLDMLQAMSTGHDGSLATVHANSAEDALMRLQTLSSMSEVEIPFGAIKDQINSAVDVIVQLTRHADGSRRITEIAVVDSYGHEEYRIVSVCRFLTQPMTQDGRVYGNFAYYPLPRRVAERLYMKGESIPAAFGVAQSDDQLATRRSTAWRMPPSVPLPPGAPNGAVHVPPPHGTAPPNGTAHVPPHGTAPPNGAVHVPPPPAAPTTP